MSIEKNTSFIPIRTIKTKLNTIPIQSGQIILVIDTQEIYLDCIKNSTLQRILFNNTTDVLPKTTEISFNDDGFDLSYILKDTNLLNNYIIEKNRDETEITGILNKTTGDYIKIKGLNLDDDETQIRALTFDEINVILNSVG